ncbi:MAG TPA: N-acetyltransferase [Campylobacterales bacterium]|nr:N-acetyltransferase [Campylobacterales bacterium]
MVKLVKATLLDIPEMQKMVQSEVKDGIILERNEDEVATNIRSYVLAKENDILLGYAALHIHSARLAEIRSLIVADGHRGKNIGKKIVLFALNEAQELQVSEEVLVLTYLPDFFRKMDFVEIAKETIPEHKIWTDCIKCIHFPICNEISLVYKLVS